MPDIDLGPWGLPPPATVRRPGGSTNNDVFVLDETWVLRIYRNLDAAQIAAEHRLLTALNGVDLPFAVPAPVPTRDGRTACGAAALFPFVAGRRAEGHDLRSVELAAEALGLLDDALARLPHDLAPRGLLPGLADLHPRAGDLDGVADDLARLAPGHDGVAWFRAHAAPADERYQARLTALPVQLIHSDYSLWNVLVTDDRVTAVLDWEVAGPDLRINDAVGAMFMAAGFGEPGDATRLAAFRRGHARTATVTPAEEAAIPELLRYRALRGVVWRVGRWRAGVGTADEVLERLTEAVRFEHRLPMIENALLVEGHG